MLSITNIRIRSTSLTALYYLITTSASISHNIIAFIAIIPNTPHIINTTSHPTLTASPSTLTPQTSHPYPTFTTSHPLTHHYSERKLKLVCNGA